MFLLDLLKEIEMIIDIYVSPEAIKTCTWLFHLNTEKKGFLYNQIDLKIYIKHIIIKKHIELSFVWFILKVFQRHKRNHFLFNNSSACQRFFVWEMCVFLFLLKGNQEEEFMRKLLSDTLIRACNNWLIIRKGENLMQLFLWKFIVLNNCKKVIVKLSGSMYFIKVLCWEDLTSGIIRPYPYCWRELFYSLFPINELFKVSISLNYIF